MKSLNIKMPMTIVQEMDNNGQLNPDYITSFIITHFSYANTITDKPIDGLSYNYTFKVKSDLHKMVKLKSIELDIPMNELVGRLLSYYYKG